MRSASGRDLAKALERNGWLLLRVHGDRPLKTGLLRHLLGLAGLSDDALCAACVPAGGRREATARGLMQVQRPS